VDAQKLFRLFDRAARFLRAQSRPLLVILDDMQWADELSLSFTKFVAPDLKSASLLLLVLYRARAGAPNEALARTVGALAREDPSRTLVLRGLSREQVAKLAATVQGRPLSPEALTRVYEKTEGNPLFVTQLLHGMRGGTEGSGTSAMLSSDMM